MINRKVVKIVVYLMIASMLLSTLVMGLGMMFG
ncbi:stressosome-associated protein Prli42 [Paenibacillus sp. IB182496]|uniref:Stressosome-associated protein Prli42 n=1 Tax=Paenibacillus sabuli TaxID=2772509 RepID=A0A927BXA5_9BACL|nr:stressosome-associated protein Prli42 [Paenibacillus sabuli]MBD2847315.1 stressosome-associated protein Prli42 [Paenibacillus sabuli]